MSPTRPNMSITMPPGLGFETPIFDANLPETPKHDMDNAASPSETPLPPQPPPPPRQTYKVRRRRATVQPTAYPDMLASDHVIPTIEMSEAIDGSPEMYTPMILATPASNGLLAPLPPQTRGISPPQTPNPRIHSIFGRLESPAKEWGLIDDCRNQRKPFERTGSVGSSFSDSSIASLGSSAFSVGSPESEATDPFMDDELKQDKLVISPSLDATPSAKRAKTHRRAMWTPAMDEHLWITYMAYLSDPTLTPFKMLPGTAPPLGVCHRVASKAKRTWKDVRTVSSTSSLDAIFGGPTARRQGSPDTIRPEVGGSRDLKPQQPQWPRSESETRRRLRALCRRRPSLSAHYQRLLRTRSPSPFLSSASTTRSSEPPSAFASSDLKLSLITSTNPSMQPDGPLAQLASDDASAARPQSQRTSRPADWFARIGRSHAHQKSLSLQSGLGLDTKSLNKPVASLASPFDDASGRSHLLQSMSTTKSLGRDFNRGAPFLESPFEVQGAPTGPRSLKRRFRSDEEKPKRLPLNDVFGPQQGTNDVVRNRGFSVGASRASDSLAKLFTPPILHTVAASPVSAANSGLDHEMSEASSDLPDVSMLGPPGSRSAPRRLAEPTPRLGSPFMETAPSSSSNSRPFNTFPRSFIPTADNPQPFHQRLQELAAQRTENHGL